MLDAKQQKKIEEYNRGIEDAILISRMCDVEGFKILNDFVESERIKAQRPDVFEITSDGKNAAEEVYKNKGKAEFIYTLIQYFESSVKKALQPRKDPITGEPEKLNDKKAE